MRLGKLSNEQLDRLVLSKFAHTRKEVLTSPRIGADCVGVDLGGHLAVLSTDPITSALKHLGRLTVHVNCNDAAAAGAQPIGMMVTLLAPPSTTEADIEAFAEELSATAREVGIDIIGGHTEVTDAVTRMVTSATVIAKAGPNGMISPDGMRQGDDIVLTKSAGLEGAAVIVSDYAHALSLSAEEREEVRGFLSQISVVKEGLYAAGLGATAMHDVTEGGVLGACWEMAQAAGLGMTVFRERIPVHPLTAKLCAGLNINPLRLLSSGAMLIACGDGQAMVNGLRALGIDAAIIGKAEGRDVRFEDGTIIAPPEADELYKLFA